MQLGLPFRQPPPEREYVLTVAGHPVPIEFVRNRRARHYILRVNADGRVRVTVPWNGSRAEALRFVEERREWLVRERYARAVDAAKRGPWKAGTRILFLGEEFTLQTSELDARRIRVSFADQSFVIPIDRAANLRAPVEAWLRRCATIDLPERLARLALQHGFDVKALSIRNQRSRWGSCSASGRISLNWRLIQFPTHVVDYVLIHELVHLRHMNHSRRFWTEVARLCPGFQASRTWLRARQRTDGDQL
jgi:predicted metal-dependent hydrolase